MKFKFLSSDEIHGNKNGPLCNKLAEHCATTRKLQILFKKKMLVFANVYGRFVAILKKEMFFYTTVPRAIQELRYARFMFEKLVNPWLAHAVTLRRAL